MHPTDPTTATLTELSAASHPTLNAMFYGAALLYAISLLVAVLRPAWGRLPAALGVVLHVAAMVGRGWIIAYLPLTNKLESFSAASLALAGVAAFAWRPCRAFVVSLMFVALAFLAAALYLFPLDLSYPPPLMRTIWYPLHVPLSFFSYALWVASGAAGLAWLRGRNAEWLRRVDLFALQGLGVWSVAMICGGIWGVVAWGAYFLWDPKVIWSVILWFHYAAFIHVRLTPSLRGRTWVRPALAWLGTAWVFIAFVGTSFFFGKSSHAF